MSIFAITSHQYTITLYTPGHLQISWDVFAKKSADILSFRISFITISNVPLIQIRKVVILSEFSHVTQLKTPEFKAHGDPLDLEP